MVPFSKAHNNGHSAEQTDSVGLRPVGGYSVPIAADRVRFSGHSALFSQAAETLTGTSNVKSFFVGAKKGDCQSLADEWRAEGPNMELGALQTFCFRHELDDGFLFLAPLTTVLFLFDAFLGLDVESLCSDDALWREFTESARRTPELTDVELEVLAGEAPRLGTLRPDWFDQAVADGTREPDWQTKYTGQNLQKSVAYLGDETLYWERRAFELKGRVFPWTLVFSAARSDSSAVRCPALDLESIPLPDFEQASSPDERKTMIVRVATGSTTEEAWRALKPGDFLTTDAPSDKLFDAIVDGDVVFRVKPGLYRGQTAVQIKERV
ncbi:MAG: FliM/FliN family flagellar motor switch protein [Thermoguttaceae bacterium]